MILIEALFQLIWVTVMKFPLGAYQMTGIQLFLEAMSWLIVLAKKDVFHDRIDEAWLNWIKTGMQGT